MKKVKTCLGVVLGVALVSGAVYVFGQLMVDYRCAAVPYPVGCVGR